MVSVTELFVRVREGMTRRLCAQTMVEYALILASVGIVAWGAYNLMGHDIGSMANGIDSALTSA